MEVAPIIKAYSIEVQPPSLEHLVSDLERIAARGDITFVMFNRDSPVSEIVRTHVPVIEIPLYRTHYLSLGTIFGAGLGVLCGLVVGNMALFGLGVGVGTSTGMAMEQFRGCVPGNGGG